MIAISTLLQHLGRPEVTEVVLQSGAQPTAHLGGVTQAIDPDALSGDDVIQLLFAAGGSRYVDSLGPRPATWRTRVEGVALSVSATQEGDVVEARFALRDGPAATAPPPLPPKARAVSAPPPRPPTARPTAPATAQAKAGPKSNRNRSDGVPSSRRPRRSGRPPAAPETGLRGRAPLEGLAPIDQLDDPVGRSTMPTPPREFVVPREALPSISELDLEVEIPSVPAGHAPRPAGAPPPPPPAPQEARRPVEDAETPEPRALAPAEVKRASPPGDAPRPAGPPVVAVAPVVVTRNAPPAQLDETPSGPPTPMSVPTLPEARRAAESLPRRSTGRSTRPFARESHAAFFRRLVRSARELNGSDLHLVAGRPSLVRTAGQLQQVGGPLDPQLVEDMVLYRLPGRLMEAFDRDGSCDFSLEEPELGRFRVNVARHRGGIKASLRLVPLYIPTLASLGLPEAIAAATRHHQGLIVLTGPTGHGKTTTLAALVDILNTESTRHVITVEDPIEFIHPRKRALLSQREVGTHTRTFDSALKAALREDPDVIVVGELRDAETVSIALEASETGHLVLGTMSTPSAAKTIDRLIDLFPPGDQQQVRMTLAGGLRLIVSQRLLPDAEGRGMVAAAEVLPGILPLWNLIRDNRTYQIPSLQQRGRELGVIRLDDSLRDLVRSGKIAAAAAVAMAESPEELEQALGLRRSSQSMPAVQPSSPGGQPGAPAPSPRGTSPVRPDVKPPEPAPSRGIFDRVFKKGS